LAVASRSCKASGGGRASRCGSTSLADRRALPATTEYVTLNCISNNVGGDLMSTGAFTGAPLRDVVAMASPQAQASWVAFRARDGYTESLPLSTIQASPEILIAYELGGAPLPAQHGYPARILIPGHYGMKGPKWLDTIDLVNHETGGYWEQQGGDHNAVVKTTSRLAAPRDGEIIKLGTIDVGGVAVAGTRGVSAVGDTTHGGSTWVTGPLAPP